MGTMTIAITIIAISAIAGCGILANSLRHRRKELNEAAITYSKLLAEKEKVEVLLEKARKELAEVTKSRYVLEDNYANLEKIAIAEGQRRLDAEKRLRFAHQRHPKTKALLPMGTNPDGTNV